MNDRGVSYIWWKGDFVWDCWSVWWCWIRLAFTVAAERMRVGTMEIQVPGVQSIVFMAFRLSLLVSIAVLDGYGIHSRSRMNARWYNRDTGTRRLIVSMEFHPRLLVSIAVLDMASIHIRIRMRARWYNGDRYPASDCVHGI